KEPIRILDAGDGKELKTLEGHTGELLAIQYLPDGKSLVSAARDETLRVWNTETGKQLQEVKLAVGQTLAMAVSPDSKTIASGGSGGTQMWRFGADAAVIAKKDADPMPKVEVKKDPTPLQEGLIKTSEPVSDRVVSAFYSSNGKVLYVASRAGAVHALDPS